MEVKGMQIDFLKFLIHIDPCFEERLHEFTFPTEVQNHDFIQ